MDAYRVDPAQLISVSGQMRTGASGIESELARLRSAVGSLHGSWAGNGEQRFQELLDQWQTSAQHLHAALTEIATMTQQAGATYQETDQHVAATFGRR